MSSSYIILLITTALLATIVNAQPPVVPIRDCPPNAVWGRCQIPCSPSCDSINDPNPVRCYSLLCRPGCNCIEGYVRKAENSFECILKDDCPRNPKNP